MTIAPLDQPHTKPSLLLLLSRFSRVQLCVTPLTVVRQAPLSLGFSRQEYWSRLPCPPPGDLSKLEIKPGFDLTDQRGGRGGKVSFVSPMSPELAGWFFTTSAAW